MLETWETCDAQATKDNSLSTTVVPRNIAGVPGQQDAMTLTQTAVATCSTNGYH
jgi:hypothetical protein